MATVLGHREELAWAAGLFEGEGCFSLQKGGSSAARLPTAQLTSTDRDVIERFARCFPFGKVRQLRRTSFKDHWKDQWTWSCHNFEGVQALIAALWPWLGARRQERATEVLRANAELGKPRPRRDPVCTEDGCNRPHCARGMCTLHWNRWNRNRKRFLNKVEVA